MAKPSHMAQNTEIEIKTPSTLGTQKLGTQRLDLSAAPKLVAVVRDLLRSGTPVCFPAPGLSMLPAIQDGDVLHVAPVRADDLRRGEIILVDDGGKLRAHRLIVSDARAERFGTQGDASLEPDAPVRAHQILG